MLESSSVLGRIARFPLRFLSPDLVLPVLHGPLRGCRWVVGSAHHACWLGIYESQKVSLVAKELKPGSVFYDVGANAGFYSLLAGRIINLGKAYAFEPLPRNVRYLRRHLELNRIRNVEVIELAVSDSVGRALFDELGDSAMGRLAQEGKLCVRTATLDSLVREEGISPPNVIKMDIEGAELRALRGASESIQRYRPVIFLATHGRKVHEGCCQLLQSWGYECRLLGGFLEERGEIIARPCR